MRHIFWIIVMVVFLITSAQADSYPGFAVVELFTSEGCSSCPPADEIAINLQKRAEKNHQLVYVLGFHVDYWNYLGWPDVFSKSEYSQRQRQYAKKLHASGVYTPQVIVNGREAFGGYERQRLSEAVDQSLWKSPPAVIKLEIKKDEGQYLIFYRLFGFDPNDILNVAVVEDNLHSDVTGGENAGRVLKHTNVVRLFQSLPVEGASGQITLPVNPQWKEENLTIVVFLQNVRDFRISAAAAINTE